MINAKRLSVFEGGKGRGRALKASNQSPLVAGSGAVKIYSRVGPFNLKLFFRFVFVNASKI